MLYHPQLDAESGLVAPGGDALAFRLDLMTSRDADGETVQVCEDKDSY